MDLSPAVCATSTAAAACKPLRYHLRELNHAFETGRPLEAAISAIAASLSTLERATESAAAAAEAAAASYAAQMAIAASTRESASPLERVDELPESDSEEKKGEHDFSDVNQDCSSQPNGIYSALENRHVDGTENGPCKQEEAAQYQHSETQCDGIAPNSSGYAPELFLFKASPDISPYAHENIVVDDDVQCRPCVGTESSPHCIDSSGESKELVAMPDVSAKYEQSEQVAHGGKSGAAGHDDSQEPLFAAQTKHEMDAFHSFEDDDQPPRKRLCPGSPLQNPNIGDPRHPTLDERISLLRHLLREPSDPNIIRKPGETAEGVQTVEYVHREPKHEHGTVREGLEGYHEHDQSNDTKDESSGSEYVANSSENSDDSGSRGTDEGFASDIEPSRHDDDDDEDDGEGKELTRKKFGRFRANPTMYTPENSKKSNELSSHPLVTRHGALKTAISLVPDDMNGMELVPGMTIRACILFDFMQKLANHVYGEMLEAVLALQTSQYWSLRCHRHGRAPKVGGRVKSKSKKCNCAWRVCMRVINEQETIAAKQRAPTEEEREAQIAVAILRVNSFYPNHTGHEAEPYLRGPGIPSVRKRREHPVPPPITATRQRK